MAKQPTKLKAPKKLEKISQTEQNDAKLLEEVQAHQTDSDKWLSTLRDGWDEKEALLISSLQDSGSQKTKSKIFDPRLSTIVFERAARVMAQNPRGKAFAVSKDDLGKNMLMNLLLNHARKNANEQFSYLIKLRFLDLYSLVYGSMFGLVPWRVNTRNGYIGPELLVLPIRDCFPQPGTRNIDEMDWFTVRTLTNAEWLESQDPTVWNIDAIKRLVEELKKEKDEGDGKAMNNTNERSFVERTYFPNNNGDAVYPRVELFTEYRSDMWITWAPRRVDKETSKPYILRTVKNPYPDGMLPIVVKHAFPLLDSPIGMGEFERGKSLQYAINSLINLYMDGVKYSIFPPLAINPDNVVPSSIKWGAGEKWFMNQPNVDLQPVNLSPRGLDTFNSTYGFMLSALLNQAGTSEVTASSTTESTLGKTPDAIKFTAARESARDEWDRFMMEDTITQIETRFIALFANKMEADVSLRLFKDEIAEIQKEYPDAVELFRSGNRGQVKVNKKMINSKYDYELETGSTVKPNIEADQNNITSVLKAVIENPRIVEELAKSGETVDIGWLFKEWVKAGGLKNADRIIVKVKPQVSQAGAELPNAQLPPEQIPPQVQPPVTPAEQQVVPEAQPQEVAPAPQAENGVPQFRDPEINAAVSQILGGMTGVPVSQG